MFVFRKIRRALFSCNTRFVIRLFVFLPFTLKYRFFCLKDCGCRAKTESGTSSIQSYWIAEGKIFLTWGDFLLQSLCKISCENSIFLSWTRFCAKSVTNTFLADMNFFEVAVKGMRWSYLWMLFKCLPCRLRTGIWLFG